MILKTIFFLWLALSGWLFRVLIFATWVLPFAAPLVIGAVANNLVIKVLLAVVFTCRPCDFVLVYMWLKFVTLLIG